MSRSVLLKSVFLAAAAAAIAVGGVWAQGGKDAPAQAGTKAPVKISMHFPFNSQRDTKEVFAKAAAYAKEKIGVEVDFVPYDGFDNYQQKMVLQTTAGDALDLVWTSHWNFNFLEQINKGSFLPLDGLIEKNMPKYYSYVPKTVWDILRYADGKLYTVPFTEYPVRQNGMWFRKDLADKYKLDVKAVEKDWRAMEPWLKAVKQGEPSVTPLAVGSGTSIGWAFEAFKPYVVLYNNSIVMKNAPTKVLNMWNDPANIAEMRTMNQWYKAGFIRQDAFTIKDINPEIKAQKFAAGSMVVGLDAENKFKAEQGFDVVIARFGKPIVARDSVAGSQFAVSRTSKNPEAALAFLDLLNSDKALFNTICFGIEGKHYKKTSENRIEKIADSGYDPNLTWVFGNTHLAYLLPGMSDTQIADAQRALKEAELRLHADFVFNPEPIKTVNAAWLTIWNEIGESMGIGIFDPDKDLPAVLEKQKKIDLDKEIAEVQKQLDAYLAAKKK